MDKKIIIAAILAIAVIAYFIFGNSNTTGNTVSAESYIEEADSLKIPLSSVSKNANWHEYQGIKFFVVSSGSDVKVAFDACDICGGNKGGYRQEGNDMVCNNCGNHYPIDKLGTANLKGGCWPGYLPKTIEGDYVVIKKSDIEAGRYRFE